MVPAGNKAKRLLLVNHTTITIHHHHHHHHQLKGRRMLFIGAVTRSFFQLLIVVFPTCAEQAQLNGYLEKPYS